MPKTKKLTSDAVEILHKRYFVGKPKMIALLKEERANADIAQKIYDLRIKAGLSQRALARLVGTTASVICRVESTDYDGHSIALLRRIATALDKRIDIRFAKAKRPRLA